MASGTDLEDEPPNMTPLGVELNRSARDLPTADIRGYTRPTDEHGDEAAALAGAIPRASVRDAVEAGMGPPEPRGDEALDDLRLARQAVRAAAPAPAADRDRGLRGASA